jgi:hypothetical protein
MTDWAIVIIILLALFAVGFFVLVEIDRLLEFWARHRWRP